MGSGIRGRGDAVVLRWRGRRLSLPAGRPAGGRADALGGDTVFARCLARAIAWPCGTIADRSGHTEVEDENCHDRPRAHFAEIGSGTDPARA